MILRDLQSWGSLPVSDWELEWQEENGWESGLSKKKGWNLDHWLGGTNSKENGWTKQENLTNLFCSLVMLQNQYSTFNLKTMVFTWFLKDCWCNHFLNHWTIIVHLHAFNCTMMILAMKLKPCLDCKFLQSGHCSTFRLYLTNFIRSWTS